MRLALVLVAAMLVGCTQTALPNAPPEGARVGQTEGTAADDAGQSGHEETDHAADEEHTDSHADEHDDRPHGCRLLAEVAVGFGVTDVVAWAADGRAAELAAAWDAITQLTPAPLQAAAGQVAAALGQVAAALGQVAAALGQVAAAADREPLTPASVRAMLTASEFEVALRQLTARVDEDC